MKVNNVGVLVAFFFMGLVVAVVSLGGIIATSGLQGWAVWKMISWIGLVGGFILAVCMAELLPPGHWIADVYRHSDQP